MPHKIFEIDEILRVIIQYTRDISGATTLSLAFCCKSFGEPALSLLWDYKPLNQLTALFPSILTRAPTEEEWKRFRQYTSWIRVLLVDLTPRYATPEVFLLLHLITSSSQNEPTQQAIFPNLRDLKWYGEAYSLVDLPSFVSPILIHLRVDTKTDWGVECLEYAPLEHVINSTISPSNLQSLRLRIYPRHSPSPELPELVVLHLMSLPNLARWRAAQPAPTTLISSPLRPTPSFTQVKSLTLYTWALRSWVSFISILAAEESPAPRAPTFTFGNLTHFDVNPSRGQQCIVSCIFSLTNSDISLLADALPRLQWLNLGAPCSLNACQTTFRSLHTLSTKCPGLRHLCVHINMTTLVQDIKSILGDEPETWGTPADPSVGRRVRSLELQCIHRLPLKANVSVSDLEVVGKVFFAISVTIDEVAILGSSGKLWAEVSERVRALRAQNLDI